MPWLTSVVDRLLHRLRRRRVVRWLRGRTGVPRSVLFVCRGNLCRSPFAERVFRRETSGWPIQIRAESAGFSAPDRPAPAEAVVAAARFGVDLSEHRSTVVTGALLRGVDLVCVASPDQATRLRFSQGPVAAAIIVLGDLDPMSIDERAILDPIGGPSEVFDASYARIERCVRELASLLLPSGAK